MDREKLDRKNIALGKLVYALRQSLDVHRVIGLNVSRLQGLKPEVSEVFFAYIQSLALESVAIGLCKIYERGKRNDLNSVFGILATLSSHTFSEIEARDAVRFSTKYEFTKEGTAPAALLLETVEAFLAKHEAAMNGLWCFRDKAGAHSEFGFELESLASHDEFEALFDFANDFYRFIGDKILNVGPSPMAPHVETSLLKCMRRLGVESPASQFAKKSRAAPQPPPKQVKSMGSDREN